MAPDRKTFEHDLNQSKPEYDNQEKNKKIEGGFSDFCFGSSYAVHI